DMEALSRLADLLANRGQWRAFWALAERAAGRSDLTAAAAENLVDGLLMMPEVERLAAQRLELARKVQNAVAADQRQLPEYQLNSARLHHAAGEWTEAAALIDAVRTAHPHQPRAMYLMAQNALGRGDPAAAAVICEQVLARQTSLPTQLLYAQALSETNRLELAIAELRRALERYP